MGYIDKFSIGGTEYDLADTSTIENICTDVEDGSVASKTYNAGDYILRNGQLHRVTQTIASGSAITEGVNIVSVTVGTELSDGVKKSKITYYDFTYSTASISGNGARVFTPTNPLPNNYMILGVINVSSGDNRCYPYKYNTAGEIDIQNISTSSISVNPTLTVRCLVL